MKTKYVVIVSVCVLALAILYMLIFSKESTQNFTEYDSSNYSVKKEDDNTDEEINDIGLNEDEGIVVYDTTITTVDGWTEQSLHDYYDICSFGSDKYEGTEYQVCTQQAVEVIKQLEDITGMPAVIFHTVDVGTHESDGVIYYDNSYSVTCDYEHVYYVYEKCGYAYALDAFKDYNTLVEYYETGDMGLLD